MSNTNNNMQTQTSSALHNAIMEASSKDRPSMLAHEGSLETTTEWCMENYKNVLNDIRNLLKAKAKASATELKPIEIRDERQHATANPLALIAQQQPVFHSKHIPITTLKIPQPDHNKLLPETKEKEIDKLRALISLSFRKSTNLPTTTSELHQTPIEQIRIIHQESTKELVDWRDDTDDEPEDQELGAHYLYMAQIQKVTPDAADNSRPIFDAEPLQKAEHDNDDLAKERNLLASLIEKLKCEIDDSKNRNKFLELSNQTLVDKLKSEIECFKNKNKCLESSNNHFKEANTELANNNQLMFKDLKKFQAELDRYHDVNYASKVEIECAKAKGELVSHKMSSEKPFNKYT
ncbi:hypothetical protein Tco_0453677 [Tanacetum coccineum]